MRTLRLRCYDPDAQGGNAGGGAGTGGAAGASSGAASSASSTDDAAALKAKLAEYETKIAELSNAEKAREAAAAKAKADADAAEALKRGESEKLYAAEKAAREAAEAKLTDLSAREEKRVKALNERLKERLKELPDDARTMVTDTGLSGDDLAHYLDRHWQRLAGEPRPAGGVRGVRSNTDTSGIPAEIVAEAARYGKEPAAWWAIVKSSDPRRAARLTPGAN